MEIFIFIVALIDQTRKHGLPTQTDRQQQQQQQQHTTENKKKQECIFEALQSSSVENIEAS